MQGRKNWKGLQCWLIWVLLLICFLEAALGDELYAGKCGKKLDYEYEESYNTLTIWGTGAMNNYALKSGEPSTPWMNYRHQIRSVVIVNVSQDEKVTTIGNYAFYDCEQLTSITIPDSIESIGENAFAGCSALNTIHVDSCNSNSANWAYENGLGDKVEAKFHQIVDVEAKQPTCTEEGYTSGKRCINCQKIIEASEPIPALGHAFGAPSYIWNLC